MEQPSPRLKSHRPLCEKEREEDEIYRWKKRLKFKINVTLFWWMDEYEMDDGLAMNKCESMMV